MRSAGRGHDFFGFSFTMTWYSSWQPGAKKQRPELLYCSLFLPARRRSSAVRIQPANSGTEIGLNSFPFEKRALGENGPPEDFQRPIL
jgi:hypothetical protein